MSAKDIDQVKRSSSSNHSNTISADSSILTGNQLRQDFRRWLSPPDPSTNHNIACSAHHEGTATWFIQGNIFNEWRSSGPLLWIHGKRVPHLPLPT
jgi:hypothetical protein